MNYPNKKFEKELIVKSSTDNLAQIRDFTKQAADECGCSEETAGKIVLAVDEACTNIIKHAYNFSPNGKICCNIKYDNTKFLVSITDDGLHFDPNNVPEPDIVEYYKQKKVGGLGIYLIKKLMDEVIYSTKSGNKNEVVLVKYLTR